MAIFGKALESVEKRWRVVDEVLYQICISTASGCSDLISGLSAKFKHLFFRFQSQKSQKPDLDRKDTGDYGPHQAGPANWAAQGNNTGNSNGRLASHVA